MSYVPDQRGVFGRPVQPGKGGPGDRRREDPPGGERSCLTPRRTWWWTARAYTIVPGFVDIHIHGCAGADTCDGTREAIDTMAKFLITKGVTSFCPTTMTVGGGGDPGGAAGRQGLHGRPCPGGRPGGGREHGGALHLLGEKGRPEGGGHPPAGHRPVPPVL